MPIKILGYLPMFSLLFKPFLLALIPKGVKVHPIHVERDSHRTGLKFCIGKILLSLRRIPLINMSRWYTTCKSHRKSEHWSSGPIFLSTLSPKNGHLHFGSYATNTADPNHRPCPYLAQNCSLVTFKLTARGLDSYSFDEKRGGTSISSLVSQPKKAKDVPLGVWDWS